MLALVVVVVPVDMVLEIGGVESCVGCDVDGTTVAEVVGNGRGGGGGGGTTCTCGGATTMAVGNVVPVVLLLVVLTVFKTVLFVTNDVTDAKFDDDEDRPDFFATESSTSECCIMSRFLQLSAMLSRFFQMVATVLLARPSSRATSLLLLPRSISWMIFIFCLIVNASRFRPCVCRFRDAQ